MDTQKQFEIKLIYDKIENILRKCALTPSLSDISFNYQNIFRDTAYFKTIDKQRLHPWVLAYIARTLVKVTSDCNRPKVLDHDDYERIAHLYYRSLDPAIKEIPNVAPLFTLATTYEQLFWHEYIANLLPRYYLIFSHRDNEGEELQSIRARLADYILELTGMSLLHYMQLGMLICFTMRDVGIYRPQSILGCKIDVFRDICISEKLDPFIALVGISAQEFRKRVQQTDDKKPLMQKYTLNLLFEKPIISTTADTVAPIPRLLIDKVSQGIYFDLFNYIKDATGDAQWFPNAFGQLFEDYIGTLLADRYHTGENLYHGDNYDFSGYAGKRCDWIIFERDAIVLLETKSARFPRYVIESMDINLVREFVSSRYLNEAGADQLLECRDYFRGKYPQRPVYLLIATLDIFPHFNFLRGYFEDHDKQIEKVEQNQIQFINITDLEMLLTSHKYSMSDVIQAKIADESGILTWFGQFMNQMQGADFRRTPKLLDETFSRCFRCEPCN